MLQSARGENDKNANGELDTGDIVHCVRPPEATTCPQAAYTPHIRRRQRPRNSAMCAREQHTNIQTTAFSGIFFVELAIARSQSKVMFVQ